MEASLRCPIPPPEAKTNITDQEPTNHPLTCEGVSGIGWALPTRFQVEDVKRFLVGSAHPTSESTGYWQGAAWVVAGRAGGNGAIGPVKVIDRVRGFDSLPPDGG